LNYCIITYVKRINAFGDWKKKKKKKKGKENKVKKKDKPKKK